MCLGRGACRDTSCKLLREMVSILVGKVIGNGFNRITYSKDLHSSCKIVEKLPHGKCSPSHMYFWHLCKTLILLLLSLITVPYQYGVRGTIVAFKDLNYS